MRRIDQTFTASKLFALDLFSGVGGWTLACEAHGIATAAACEIDEWKRAQYAAHFPGVRLYRDVREVTAKRLADDGCGPIQLVCGSPPCTDASAANHRGRGIDGDETGLFFEAIRIVDEVRPHWACFENSPRLRTRGVDRVLGELERCGYACWPLVVGAIHVGAPHLRQRLWLVAADADRAGIREQQGRSGGSERLGSAKPAHDVDANSKGQPGLPVDAEVGWRARADGVGDRGAIAANPHGKPWRSRAARQDWPQACHGALDPDRQSLAVGEGQRRDIRPRSASAQRATHGGWAEPATALAGHLRVDDGISPALAADCRSAYGDAIVPQAGAAILKAILMTEASFLRRAA